MATSRITVKERTKFTSIVEELKLLAGVEVLVGFPAETTERDDEAERGDITNAALAYIHDTGMPEQNIPARPFMRPAIESVEKKIGARLGKTAKLAMSGDRGAVEDGMHAVGMIAKLAIQNKINEGIPPPLADSTLRARARRGRKGAKEELEARRKGEAPGMALAKPLVDTAQMRNAANYAIRAKSKRSS